MAATDTQEAPPFDQDAVEAQDIGQGDVTELAVAADPAGTEGEGEPVSSIREYVILKVDKKIAQEVSRVFVSTKEAALKTLGEQTAEQGGDFRVVTARSWDPVFTVGIERETTIKITPQ